MPNESSKIKSSGYTDRGTDWPSSGSRFLYLLDSNYLYLPFMRALAPCEIREYNPIYLNI